VPVAGAGRGPTVQAVEQALTDTGYSRFPVTGVDGSFIGYLHIKDLLSLGLNDDADSHAVIDPAIVRPLPEVPESMLLPEALSRMRRSKSHLALVT
ncbi:CBS domain-containing protein, partial [Mycobacterium celatum]